MTDKSLDWISKAALGLLLFLIHCSASTAAIQPKIVGGEFSKPGEFPFMAALIYNTAAQIKLVDDGTTYKSGFLSRGKIEGYKANGIACNWTDSSSGCSSSVSKNICVFYMSLTLGAQTQLSSCTEAGGIAAIVLTPENFSGNDALSYLAQAEDLAPQIPVNHLNSGHSQGFVDTFGRFVAAGLPLVIESTPEPRDYAFCGGTYIGEDWVLTAAHCIKGKNKDSFVVNVGTDNLIKGKTNILGVKSFFTLKNYDPKTLSHDIGLIQLKHTPIGVKPLKIAPEEFLAQRIEDLGEATVIGFGLQKAGDFFSRSSVLKQANIQIIPQATCSATLFDAYNQDRFPLELKLDETMFCAGSGNGSGSCPGDSGGPILIKKDSEYLQAGLTSWGISCDDFPSVFTNAPSFVESIEKKTGLSLQASVLADSGGALLSDSANQSDSGSNSGGGSFGLVVFLLVFVRALFSRLRQTTGQTSPTTD